MSQRIIVDPVTRIEGHLRIDCEVDRARSRRPGPRARCGAGSRPILLGRDPRDAWLFTQRFCGVCTTVHAIASVRTVENALGLEIPMNAQYIRNLIVMAHAMHDHIVHFYQLSALDWVDVVSALKADPAKASALGREPVALARQQQGAAQGGAGQGQERSSRPASSASSPTATGATRR